MVEWALSSHPKVVMRSFSMDHGALDQFMVLRDYRLLDEQERDRPFRGTITHQWGDFFIKSTFKLSLLRFWKAVSCFFPPERVLILNRRNLLRRYLSHELARQTTFSVQKPRSYAPTIEFDFSEFLGDVKDISKYRYEAEKAFPGALHVYYEDLVADWPGEIRKIQEYLGMPVLDLQPHTYRQETRPLRQIIRNWPETEQKLRTCGFGDWLDGV
jgi:hypothetical protein